MPDVEVLQDLEVEIAIALPEAHEPIVARAPSGQYVMWFTSGSEADHFACLIYGGADHPSPNPNPNPNLRDQVVDDQWSEVDHAAAIQMLG